MITDESSKEVVSKDEKHGGYFPLYLHHNKGLIRTKYIDIIGITIIETIIH